MDNRLQGKVAVITGGGSGIGAATARRFVASGAQVVITGRRIEALNTVAEKTGGLAVPGDVSDEAHCQEVVKAAVEEFGGLDILVSNAGVETFGSVTEVDVQEWHKVFRINVDGLLLTTRAAIEPMRRRGGGAIVAVSSVGALVSPEAYAAYTSSKAAVIGLTRSIARDYGGDNIRANVICPGWTRSEMVERALKELAGPQMGLEEAIRRATMHYPLQRMADPSEIASCIQFLASEESSFVTGSTLVADGGALLIDIGMIELSK